MKAVLVNSEQIHSTHLRPDLFEQQPAWVNIPGNEHMQKSKKLLYLCKLGDMQIMT